MSNPMECERCGADPHGPCRLNNCFICPKCGTAHDFDPRLSSWTTPFPEDSWSVSLTDPVTSSATNLVTLPETFGDMDNLNRHLSTPIVCGETTCAREFGKLCQFTRQRMDGARPRCHLFEEPLKETGEPEGWLKRVDKCLEAERF